AAPSRAARVAVMERDGYPTYTTSAGWLGYPDDKVRQLCREMTARGWKNFKIKVGRNLDDDIRRCRIMREELGWDCRLMVDAEKLAGPVWPHAGGSVLCEMVQHLSIIDYVCISASLEDRLTEYSDHLHDTFVDPVITRAGRYIAPQAPGYSTTITPEALAE